MKLLSIFTSTLFLAGILLGGCSSYRHIPADIADTYYGFLPCADCPGISYTLELHQKGDYSLTMDYYDRETTFVTEDKFTYKNNKIKLFSEGEITSRFEVEGDKLIALDADGNRIETNLAPYYQLYKGDPTKADMPTDFGILNTPIIYKGTGNEPFWMVQITSSNTLIFKGLMENGEVEFELPVAKVELSDDNNSIVYTGKNERHKLKVKIANKACQDNMSGQHFTTTLRVEYTSDGQKKTLNGCGEFKGKYQLNGTWEVISMDGQPIQGKKPTLGIYLPETRMAGSTSCNRYFGSIESTARTLSFDQVGATRMACPDMSSEDKFLSLLGQDDITWEIDDDGKLTLSGEAGTIVFSRTDSM
ncbi:META domain-containing protein [Membranicola marinus]|uniref:META domain-containing protein n=1 Tax=Membranihabitans marinus TaxID=1227546 RepID=A0A953HW44_9BACT|nr:META domain-containing protein [Membranihabitans marinus]MBY5956867.1 META domain-containing protein [Membranihabitans marinus]